MDLAPVLGALDALFRPSSKASDRKAADEWLKAFQKTPAAWAIADALISPATDAPAEARLFAAQTFRQKISFDMDDLDSPSRQALYSALVKLLYTHRHGARALVTQLILALADLSVFLSVSENLSLDPVSSLLNDYASEPEMLSCILEFLTELPAELHEGRLFGHDGEDAQRDTARAKLLTANAQKVLQFLLSVHEIADGSTVVADHKLACLAGWMRHGDLSLAQITQTPLFGQAFEALSIESAFDDGCDVISEIVYRASRQSPKDMALIERIYSHLSPLRSVLQSSLDDLDKTRGLCKVFVEAGEAFLDLLIQSPDPFRDIVDGILTCAAYDDLEVVQLTFSFWHSLTDGLFARPEAIKNPFFTNVYEALVDLTLKHLHYPQELSAWTAYERDEFREFRHTIGQVLKDCVRILGEEAALRRPFKQLTMKMSSLTPGTPIQDNTWQALEAALFSLRTMGGEVSVNESVVLPQVMALLPQLPQHPKIRYAVILVMGRYAEWTNCHPDYISYQLQYISAGFEDKDSVAAAAQTLRDLCKYCAPHLVSFLPDLHSFYMNILRLLPYQDRTQVIEAVAHVLSAVSRENLLGAIQNFVLPIIQRLHELASVSQPVTSTQPSIASNSTGQQSKDIVSEATDLLDSFAIMLKYLVPNVPAEDSHPCVSILTETWPVIKSIITVYGTDQRLSEAGARLIRSSLVSYRLHMTPLAPEWAESLCVFFEKTGHGCWLWVSCKFVKYYGGIDRPTTGIADALVQRLTMAFFGLITKTEDIDNLDEVVEDYFNMIAEHMAQSPEAFVRLPHLSSMFQCALKCLAINSAASLTAIYAWLTDVMDLVLKAKIPEALYPAIAQPLSDPSIGGSLIKSSFHGLLTTFPREREVTSYVATWFVAYSQVSPQFLFEAMNEVIEGFTDEEIPRAMKDKFKLKFQT